MKAKKLLLSSLFVVLSTPIMAGALEPTQTLLPEVFAVYTDGTTVLNHPQPGFMEAFLPTINLYKGSPGCYIACYSHQRDNSIYSVGDNIYVMGQVRVAGKYTGRICEPTNFAGKDISANDIFKTICTGKIEACKTAQCWAGGDTGGWFGIQP
jgi:hypothetical protein